MAPDQRRAAEYVLAANLRRAADLAGEKGLGLLIEPLNHRDRPDYVLHLPEQAAAIIERVGRANVRMQFDFYHVQIEAGDLFTRFARHLAVIGHVQVAAVPSRAEPDEGEVNYPAVFQMIDRSGYAGWVGCEYKPRARTEDGLGWCQGSTWAWRLTVPVRGFGREDGYRIHILLYGRVCTSPHAGRGAVSVPHHKCFDHLPQGRFGASAVGLHFAEGPGTLCHSRRPVGGRLNEDDMPESAGLLRGKRGLILGVANNRSIAWGIAANRRGPMVRSWPSPIRAMP